MTKHELNIDITKLNNFIEALTQDAERTGNNDFYYRGIAEYATQEFIRLNRAANDFEALTKNSILILLKLNRQHRFIPLHTFGILINI